MGHNSHTSLNNINQSSRKGNIIKSCLFGEHLLTFLTAISTVVGILVGFLVKTYMKAEWSKRQLMYIQFPGDLFLRMLKVMIIPLLTCSIIASIGSLDLGLSKKIGLLSILYYFTTTSVAVFQGIFWVLLFSPGKGQKTAQTLDKGHISHRIVTTTDTILDLIRNIFPPNIVEACIRQDQTQIKNQTATTNDTDIYNWDYDIKTVDGSNVLGLVMFSVVLGITIAKMGKPAEPLLKLIQSLADATMAMTKAIIWLSPMGVFFLVIKNVLEIKSFYDMITQLGMYFFTVLLGLMVHGFITVPGIYVLCTRELPIKFIMNMGPAIATAFGTASSSASLPVSMHCLEERNKIDVRVSRFVMPIGANINMDGTALYEAVAAIFIAQYNDRPLSIVDLLAISITATMASIGAAGIPQAGLVTMVMVLDTVGLPSDNIALILAVDWLLDRFRTVVNVLGDAIGGGIIAKISKDELLRLDAEGKGEDMYPAIALTESENWNANTQI